MKAPKSPPRFDRRAAASRAEGPPAVGATPHTVVWTENKWRLLRFAPRRRLAQFKTPVLLVPSLINRWYVLDLGTGRSLIEWLVAQGHDVFCIDWGTPGAEDRYLTWDDIAGRYLGRAVRMATRFGRRGDAHVLGYCLGGTLATTLRRRVPRVRRALPRARRAGRLRATPASWRRGRARRRSTSARSSKRSATCRGR